MAATYTANITVGSLSGTTLAASGTQTFTVDVTAYDLGQFQAITTFGTVAATAGVQVEALAQTNGVADTIPAILGVIAATASSTQRRSYRVPIGKYTITLRNLDATNAVTLVQPVLDGVPSL